MPVYGNPQINPNLRTNTYPQPTGINWVQGVEGAKAFPLLPNSHAQLMDSENENIFYIKTADNIGMCNLRVFKYEEITGQPLPSGHDDLSNYVRKDELQGLLKSMLGGNRNEQSVSTVEPSKELITR